MRFGKGLVLCALTIAVSLMAGCGGGGSGGAFFPDPNLHFVNGSPDSTSLDFYINDTLQAAAVLPFTLSPTSTTPAADDDVSVQETGTNVQLDAVTNTFKGNTDTIIATVGLENFGTEYLKRLRLLIFPTSLVPPTGNTSELIIIQGFNRAAGFTTPNVDFKQPGDNAPNPVQNIAFGTFRTTTINAGTTEYVIQRSGTNEVYIDQTNTFVAGKIYIALVTGVQGGTGELTPQIKYLPLN